MKVVRLSALGISPVPATHFCYRPSRPQGRCRAGRIKSMKNSSDLIGNRTHHHPACRAVPQQSHFVSLPQKYKVGNIPICNRGYRNTTLQTKCYIMNMIWNVRSFGMIIDIYKNVYLCNLII